MFRYFLELGYKGTHYCGWQVQNNAVTVQQRINEALAIVFNQPVETTGCGRTDTGVHATEFFLHFDLDSTIKDPGKTIYQLNSLLPADIAVYHIYNVESSAHARFDATSRSYRYFISTRKDPFLNETTWFWRSDLDIVLMNKAAALMLNQKDFTCFSKAGGQQSTNLCNLTFAHWKLHENHLIEFGVTSNRFLRGMVRAMVGTMILVGQNKMTLAEFTTILLSGKRSDAGESVPPQGLFLSEVKYPFIENKPKQISNLQFIK